MNERRQHPRQRVLKGGLVLFNNDSSSVDCVVRDLTQAGARLALESAAFVPDCFNLLINQEQQLYPAQVAWRKSNNVGVRFTGAPRPLAP
jgi:hypothetical protein